MCVSGRQCWSGKLGLVKMQTHLQHLWIKVEAGLLQSLIKLVCWDGCNSGHRHFVYHLAGMPLTSCEFGRPPWSHARLHQTCAGRKAWQRLLPSPAKVNQTMVSGTQQRIDAVGGRQVQRHTCSHQFLDQVCLPACLVGCPGLRQAAASSHGSGDLLAPVARGRRRGTRGLAMVLNHWFVMR